MSAAGGFVNDREGNGACSATDQASKRARDIHALGVSTPMPSGAAAARGSSGQSVCAGTLERRSVASGRPDVASRWWDFRTKPVDGGMRQDRHPPVPERHMGAP